MIVHVDVDVDVVVGEERPTSWSKPPAQWHPGRADVHAHVMLLQGKARYGEGGYLLAAEIGSRGIRPSVCVCVCDQDALWLDHGEMRSIRSEISVICSHLLAISIIRCHPGAANCIVV